MFRDSGGEILAALAKEGGQRSVGTGRSNLQMRLRPASAWPDKAATVCKEHELRFTAAKAVIHQVRALIALDVPFILISRGNTRILADRHPSYEATLVNAHLRRTRAAAKASGSRELADVILKNIRALQTKRRKRRDQSKLSDADAASTTPAVDPKVFSALLNALDKEGLGFEEFLKGLKIWLFQRGVGARVAELTRPTADNLEGFREDCD